MTSLLIPTFHTSQPASANRAIPRPCGIELDHVTRTFQSADGQVVRAVNDLSISLSPGSFTSFVGPSGCGKSTLLRIIAGLDHPTSGTSRFSMTDGRTQPRLGYVFQDAHLLPWRSVLGNVELPLQLQFISKQDRSEQAMHALERVGLAGFAKRFPMQLSGGMRMRVSLARAMISRPDILLLDEPFAALDEITRQQLDDQLLSLWKPGGEGARMTVVFVTHSISEAAYLSERVLVFSSRPARLVLDHSLDLPEFREPSLRTQPRFAKESGVLFSALRESFAS
jgi:NitT/TauT family transport system ATP-binding protein